MDTHNPRLISPGQRHRPLPPLHELIKTEGSAARPDLHGTAQQPINRLLPEEGLYLPFIFAQCAGNYDGRTLH